MIDLYLNRAIETPELTVPDSSPYTYHTVGKFSRFLTYGDVVQLETRFECTNDLGFDVMLASLIRESETESPISGFLIARPQGFNITPDMHHGVINTGGFYVAEESRVHHFMLVGYAASTAASPGDTIKVDYSEMHVAVHTDTPIGPFVVFDETLFGG